MAKIRKSTDPLSISNPELSKEWDYDKNAPLTPDDVTVGSNKKAWWKCSRGHEWAAVISSRKRGNGCPYCSGRKLLQGFNDFATKNPVLANEWNYEKNDPLLPNEVAAVTAKSVWWKCKNGHEWEARISNRVNGRGCPYCSNKKVLTGYNDLATTHPDLVKEWNFEKNAPLTPDNVLPGTQQKLWWICKDCGKEWQATVVNRTKGRNCPYCKPLKVSKTRKKRSIIQKGTLLDKYPDIASQWDFEKNESLTPDNVPSSTSQKVWWICARGHSWKTSIYNRIHGDGCPVCAHGGSSMPEQGIAYYLAKHCAINQRFYINNKEVDIFLPDYNIAIEYDGIYYHKKKQKQDNEKNRILASIGVVLIRVIESDHNEVIDHNIYFNTDNMGKNYVWALGQLFDVLTLITNNRVFKSICIDIDKDRLKIRERFDLVLKENSLLSLRPDIAAEWNYDKNGTLSPEIFAVSSSMKVWWRCNLGHEWKTTIDNRTNHNTKCPYCSNDKLLVGFNDFATKHPELAAEWNYEKNEGLCPEDIINNTQRNVWWKCQRGHEWRAPVLNRCQGNGCPYCCNRKILTGYNDIVTLRPDLLCEWNYTKNTRITPEMVGPGSNKKVWWICNKGHEYESLIPNRAKGHGCPYCAGRCVIKGETDLATNNPVFLKEWDYEKNGELTPDMVTSSTDKKVWWTDSLGHSWKAAISHRQSGTGCPYCSGQKVLVGFNDLATKRPDIAKEWNYDKNAGLKNGYKEDVSTPDKVTISSGIKVWWKCDKGHEWQAAPCTRLRCGCPYCAGNNYPKAVECVETGVVYKSLTEAQAQTGILRTTIGQCCNGKVKSAGGYHWKYVD